MFDLKPFPHIQFNEPRCPLVIMKSPQKQFNEPRCPPLIMKSPCMMKSESQVLKH